MSKTKTGESPGQVRVWLGNRAAIEQIPDQAKIAKMSDAELAVQGEPLLRRPIPVAKACTFFRVRPDATMLDGVQEVVRAWPHVSDAQAPAWVASTDDTYAQMISEHFGGIEIRDPEDPDVDHGPYVLDSAAAKKGA